MGAQPAGATRAHGGMCAHAREIGCAFAAHADALPLELRVSAACWHQPRARTAASSQAHGLSNPRAPAPAARRDAQHKRHDGGAGLSCRIS